MLFIVLLSLIALVVIGDIVLDGSGAPSVFMLALSLVIFFFCSLFVYSNDTEPVVEIINGELTVCTPLTEEYNTRWLFPWGDPIQKPLGEKTCVVVGV